MGKIRGSFLSGFVGTVGDQVGATWNGIHYVRSKPKRVRDANTPKQAAQRNRFKGVTRLAKDLKDTLIHPIWHITWIIHTFFYCESKLLVTIENARFSLLKIAKAISVRLKSALPNIDGTFDSHDENRMNYPGKRLIRCRVIISL